MIVDELARWKASLLHTNEAYEHHVRLALHEHADLWKSLMDTFSILSRLQVAFDPLQKSDHDVEATTLLGDFTFTFKKIPSNFFLHQLAMLHALIVS